MNHPFVDVALPLPLDQTYTYSLPPQLSSAVRLGSRVLVPFGNKRLSGIAVNFPSASSVARLKPVLELLDIEPAITAELLSLGRWISEYYLAPLGEVLKAFLPQGTSVKNEVLVSLKHPVNVDLLRQAEGASAQRRRVLLLLESGKRHTLAQLRRKSGIANIHGVLKDLTESGIIEIIDRLPSKGTAVRMERYVVRKSDPAAVTATGPAQRRLLARLTEMASEPYPLRDLLKETSASSTSLKKFIDSGVVGIVEREAKRVAAYSPEPDDARISPLQLTSHQRRVLDEILPAIDSGVARTFLLHGITGSGKTQVYIEAIREALGKGKTAIVLVPEISLTPQTVRRFRMHFGDAVAVMHSRMSDGERFDAWKGCKEGKFRIVIGPRSAIFAPLSGLGLIVVDEEHEASYKQFETAPRYNARDVAVVRGQQTNAVVLLGSATPSIESYYNTKTGKYTLLTLPERIDDAVLPSVVLVNMVDERKRRFASLKEEAKKIGKRAFEEGFHSISLLLEEKIRDRIRKGEGTILLQNRRGFAPFVECLQCAYVERCERCDVTLTYHLAKKHLRCHYCGIVKPLPAQCPKCGGGPMKLQGFGTQRVEQDVARLFPEAKVVRMDLDTTTRKGSHDRLLRQFASGEADILLGTQMVAKGLDFPRVTLVGVISADTQMLLPEFRSAERTFQLLTQVAGRAGRSALRGEVVIQSYQTDHYGLKHVLDHNFTAFYDEEIRYRNSAFYPPFTRLVLIETKGTDETKVRSVAEAIANRLRRLSPSSNLLGPAPAVIAKINDNYRWHILLKAARQNDPGAGALRRTVSRVVHEIGLSAGSKGLRISVDVDPQGIL
ncbi:MAG TPA: primosomal protein N' [Bacteroidota bacterium]|nr:primosomal protein N' [Bacteroidota bacterium]